MSRNYHMLLAVISLIVLYSCKNSTINEYKDRQDHLVMEEVYANNQTKTKIIYLNPDKTDYIYTSYYEDGTLMDSARYVNDSIEGKRIYYDESSDLKHIEHYKNGLLNGVNKAIYSNGTTSYEGYRLKGNKVGEWIFHYPEGAPITYEFYDSTGRLIYFRKYDERGRMVRTNGNPILYVSGTGRLINPDSAALEVVMVHPPLTPALLEVFISKDTKEGEKIGETEIRTPRFPCIINIDSTGKYDLVFKLNLGKPGSEAPEQFQLEKTVTIEAL